VAEGWQGLLPGWKSAILLGFSVVALLRVVVFPETVYPWYMWAAILYGLGLPVARIIDVLRSVAEFQGLEDDPEDDEHV
jgi:hypothetical protein